MSYTSKIIWVPCFSPSNYLQSKNIQKLNNTKIVDTSFYDKDTAVVNCIIAHNGIFFSQNCIFSVIYEKRKSLGKTRFIPIFPKDFSLSLKTNI